MDTAGKGGIVDHVVGSVNPHGVHIALVQGADRRGEGARLPLAHPQAAAHRRACSASSTARTTRTCSSTGCAHFSTPEVIEERYGLIVDFEKELTADGHDHHQGDAAHLARRAEGAPRGPSRRPDQALEVQPRRHRRARALAALHGGVPDRHHAHHDGCRPWYVCRPTTSGTPASPCSSCCSMRSATCGQDWPAADYDVAAQKARLAKG